MGREGLVLDVTGRCVWGAQMMLWCGFEVGLVGLRERGAAQLLGEVRCDGASYRLLA